jgi:hypothetical protein
MSSRSREGLAWAVLLGFTLLAGRWMAEHPSRRIPEPPAIAPEVDEDWAPPPPPPPPKVLPRIVFPTDSEGE